MKRISPGFRLVSRAARSPGFSMAGPEVMRIFTFSSLAMIPASVVFPKPGGPYNSTWSKDSWRSLAASINTERFSFAFSWPIYSESVLGRSGFSISASSGISSGSTIRFSKSNSKSTDYILPAIAFKVSRISSSTGNELSNLATTGATSLGV